MLSSIRKLSLYPSSGVLLRSAPVFSAQVLSQTASPPGQVTPTLVVPSISQMLCPLHTSSVLERARQSTRIRKRKVMLANKKKKEERLRKNPPPLPKKVKLMLKAKGLGDGVRMKAWRQLDNKPFPTDTAWSEKDHSWARLSVGEALSCLREHCHPTMLDIPDAMVWAKLEFNMANVKKDKYLDGFTKMVPIYHPYERGVAEKHILVFCKSSEEMAAAEAAGAKKAGGPELVQDILKGKMDVSDFDHFLSTEEMSLELKPLLGILRDKFPKKNLGNISNDIEKLVKTFAHGMLIGVKKPAKTLGYDEDPAYASCDVTLGRLSQTEAEVRGNCAESIFSFHNLLLLSGNLTTILETLRESAPKRATGGFITRCELYIEKGLKCRFSIAHDLVDDERYIKYVRESQKVSMKPDLESVVEESASN